ncbi:uncharacterized protein Bfra_002855 [Botrytis fragariae]|uniref:Uncharacterized protein n=1 Tax=Botrytis fragariae TaxID=1964551 RepID=A0A8H6ELM4_9HELO|nr:uncharacterized protein Bfra_002855 [Botrytis fragariae]KAF5876450.1 hypothetical protein Bfra_002855 [Botrytis fragariae]
MSSSFQTSIFDLTGIDVPSNSSCEWIFQGDAISMNQYSGDIAEDLASDLADENPTSSNFAASNSGQHNNFVNTSARSSSFDHHLSDSTCVAGSYADAGTSMRLHYTVPSSESMSQSSIFIPTPTTSESMSQSSIFIPTPTTSVDYNGDNNIPTSQNDSVGLQHQSAYFIFPTCASDSTPFDTWVKTPERHEQIALKMSDPTTHPATQEARN